MELDLDKKAGKKQGRLVKPIWFALLEFSVRELSEILQIRFEKKNLNTNLRKWIIQRPANSIHLHSIKKTSIINPQI